MVHHYRAFTYHHIYYHHTTRLTPVYHRLRLCLLFGGTFTATFNLPQRSVLFPDCVPIPLPRPLLRAFVCPHLDFIAPAFNRQRTERSTAACHCVYTLDIYCRHGLPRFRLLCHGLLAWQHLYAFYFICLLYHVLTLYGLVATDLPATLVHSLPYGDS